MKLLLEALNKPVDAFKRGNAKLSWALVVITIVMVTILDPVLRIFADVTDINPGIDVLHVIVLSAAGVITYCAVCTAFWIVGKIFGSLRPWQTYIRTWGITYLPTLFCAVIVSVTNNYFFLFWNSLFWGMFFTVAFGGILIWKAILYVLFFKEVAQLSGFKLVGALVLAGVAIIVLTFINASIGLITPIL